MRRKPSSWSRQGKFIAHFLYGPAWVALVIGLSWTSAYAQSKQVWPETSTYVKVNDRMRFYFLMTTVKEDKDSTEAEIGPNFDFFLPTLKLPSPLCRFL